jgi:hypothetical protein
MNRVPFSGPSPFPARAYALYLSCLRIGKQHFFEKLGI